MTVDPHTDDAATIEGIRYYRKRGTTPTEDVETLLGEVARLVSRVGTLEAERDERWRRAGMAPDAPIEQKVLYLLDRFDGHQAVIQKNQTEFFEELDRRYRIIRRAWGLRRERNAAEARAVAAERRLADTTKALQEKDAALFDLADAVSAIADVDGNEMCWCSKPKGKHDAQCSRLRTIFDSDHADRIALAGVAVVPAPEEES